MTKEDISAFTRRISQGNKSDIVVVLFDIYFAYEKDARQILSEKDERKTLSEKDMGLELDEKDARQALNEKLQIVLRKANQVVEHLKGDLDFTYEIAYQLYPLYDYVERCISRAIYSQRKEPLDEASIVMNNLRDAFIEVAKADNSERQMRNVETVTAGYTYGRGSLNEITDIDANRGFLA